MSDKQISINIDTPDGRITANKWTEDPSPRKITPVAGDELRRLETLSKDAPQFLETYLPGTSDPGLKEYDRSFRAWQTSRNKRHSDRQVVDLLGSYLGNKCVSDLAMEWVIVTDKYGTNYAVRGKTTEVIAFPFATVQKRIENKEHDFLHGVYYAIKQALESGKYKQRNEE